MFKNLMLHVYFWVGVNIIGLPVIIEHDTFETKIALFQSGLIRKF